MTSTFEQELGAVIAALEAGEGETAVAAARRCIAGAIDTDSRYLSISAL